jgi:ABC-2 type transport system ATP-binding protein
MARGSGAPAIVARGLGKRYPSKVALAGISFEVAQGEVFGLLGPNGAGKTTTLRILTGRSRPTSGYAEVMGLDVVRRRDEVTALIGVVFEEPNLYERSSGRGNLRLFSDLYGLPAGRVDEVLQLVGLSPADASRRVRTYSTGMRQRLLIARALLNRPWVLVLDEPTRGLDPITARELRGLIGQLGRDGTTILLATHVLDEVDALCSRVAFLRGGQLVTVASPQALKLQQGNQPRSCWTMPKNSWWTWMAPRAHSCWRAG